MHLSQATKYRIIISHKTEWKLHTICCELACRHYRTWLSTPNAFDSQILINFMSQADSNTFHAFGHKCKFLAWFCQNGISAFFYLKVLSQSECSTWASFIPRFFILLTKTLAELDVLVAFTCVRHRFACAIRNYLCSHIAKSLLACLCLFIKV